MLNLKHCGFGENTLVILVIGYLLLKGGGEGFLTFEFLKDNLVLVAVLAYLLLSEKDGCGMGLLGLK